MLQAVGVDHGGVAFLAHLGGEDVGHAGLEVRAGIDATATLHAVEAVGEEGVAQLHAQAPTVAQAPLRRETGTQPCLHAAGGGVGVDVGKHLALRQIEGVGSAEAGKEFEVEAGGGGARLAVEGVGEVEGGIGKESEVVPRPGGALLALRHVASLVAVVAQGGTPAPQGFPLTAYGYEETARPRIGRHFGPRQVLVGRLVGAAVELQVERVGAAGVLTVG